MKKILSVFMAFVMLFTMFATTSVVSFAEGTDVAVASDAETEDLGFFQQVGNFFDNIGKAIRDFFEDIGKAFSDFFNSIFGTGSEPVEPIKPIEPPEIKPVEKWSKQEILDFYNEAVIKTDTLENKPQGYKKMVLVGDITDDNGSMDTFNKINYPIIQDTLHRNSSSTSDIPGCGEIKLSDVRDIKATENNGAITVEIVGKEQADSAEAGDGTLGPVGRIVGTVGNIDGALNELDTVFLRGRETVSLTYTDVTVRTNIDEKTGIITGGRWHYLVNVLVFDADFKMHYDINWTVRNLRAAVDYTVTF